MSSVEGINRTWSKQTVIKYVVHRTANCKNTTESSKMGRNTTPIYSHIIIAVHQGLALQIC